MAPPGHQEGQCARRDGTDPEGNEGDRVAPLPLLAVDRPEGEAADAEGDDPGAEPVEAGAGILIATLLHVPQDRVEGQQDQRDVDQEGGPPGDGVDQDAAHERPQQRRPR